MDQDFDKCVCGERAHRTCRGCLKKKCRFCLATDFSCHVCRSAKQKKTKEELHRSNKALLGRLRSLYWKWSSFRREVFLDEQHHIESKLALRAIERARDAINDLYKEKENESTATK